MSDQRIKGQETEVLIVSKGQALDSITDVRSFEVTVKTDIIEQGYLGEKTNRYDEIFNGVSGRMDLHFENQSIFDLFADVVNRAKRKEPDTRINIKTTLNYPNGQRPRVQINDCFFGSFPISFGSRADYGSVTVEFAASDFRVITS